MPAPKKGDRVRVVLEGVVSEEIDTFGLKLDNDEGQWLAELYTDRPGVSVEVPEPPVVQFGPGDIVREKAATKPLTYLLLEGGWVVVDRPNGPAHRLTRGGHEYFTSRAFEKVDLAVVPF